MDDLQDLILIKVLDVLVFDGLHFFFGHCLIQQILQEFLSEVIALVLWYQQFLGCVFDFMNSVSLSFVFLSVIIVSLFIGLLSAFCKIRPAKSAAVLLLPEAGHKYKIYLL